MVALIAATSTAYPLLIKEIIDAFASVKAGTPEKFWFNLNASEFAKIGPYLIIIVSAIRGITWYLSTVTSNKAALISTTKLQKQLFSKLLMLDYSRIIKEQSGAYSSRFLNDINLIRDGVLKLTNSLLREILTLIGVIGAMLYSNWQLAVVALIVLPIGILPVQIIGKRLRETSRKAQDQASELSGVIEESLSGIRLVKTYGLEKQETNRVGLSLDKRMGLLLKTVEQKGRIDPILEILGGISIAFVFGFAAMQISTGQSSIGDLMGFITSLLLAAQSARSLGSLNSAFQEALASLERFYEIIDEEPEIKNSTNPINPVIRGNIEFKNVSFSHYNNNEKTQILDNINFKALNGQKIAFVGKSGSGKSTIINLIPRLYDVESGDILVDGHDIKSINIECLRSSIALVSQDSIMFEASIAENLCFGTELKSDAEITKALKDAACDFVFKLEGGIHHKIGPKGTSLSGGERQRLSIARAFLRNAPVLLLDEPTSALDAQTEAKIAKTLDKFGKNKTVLIIAHRLSTIKDCDIIFVMNNGKIIESGNHEELISKSGIYAELTKLQND